MPKRQNKVLEVANVGSLALTEEMTRNRAYQLFEQRGCEHGHDIDDWLQAEAEVVGKKVPKKVPENVSTDETETLLRAAAV